MESLRAIPIEDLHWQWSPMSEGNVFISVLEQKFLHEKDPEQHCNPPPAHPGSSERSWLVSLWIAGGGNLPGLQTQPVSSCVLRSIPCRNCTLGILQAPARVDLGLTFRGRNPHVAGAGNKP